MATLLLDQTQWDLVADAAGNIAMATEPYSRAQDVASACRLFLGEQWYNTDAGVPYYTDVLGPAPNLQIIREGLIAAALTVPGVTSAAVAISSFNDRTLTGQIQFTDTTGSVQNVTF